MKAVSQIACLVALACAIAQPALSASQADADKLGKELTPAGAEKAGNKDGTIPAWTGEGAESTGWSYGKFRGDYFKYKNEKPLFVIDASNVDKYADKLAPGEIQLIKQNKGYSMPVYPTHRSCMLPDFVAANTKKNGSASTIGPDGWTMRGETLPGVPFPIPTSGIQAVWNHLTRYQGVAAEYPAALSFVSAKTPGDPGIEYRWTLQFYWPNGAKGENHPADGSLFQGLYFGYIQPAALAGQAAMQRFYFDKPTESYYYFTGQRRVRRMPAYDYDAPSIGFENQYQVDQQDVFFGAPDRFDWKIVGKKEMYVLYNDFAMFDFRKPMSEALQASYVNPAFRRYELHRVWIIEGTVKQGMRHSNPKRTLYLDEDSWLALGGEDYDAQGKIWKWKESAIAPAWELGGACVMPQTLMYDLTSGRYLADSLIFGTGKDYHYYQTPTLPNQNDSFFTSEGLARVSDR
ncbi:DUF1329 domain-containing protein [Paraburkholderia agricolaris]|uniref:DUF1329 domain-containing protein n=1 Tax=Paraburkholderia agricolaris TaxID=2152888 RepID=UPI0012923DDD|nr:DUF1329 domain-containing protein [Paraburkholderia agricolaris]